MPSKIRSIITIVQVIRPNPPIIPLYPYPIIQLYYNLFFIKSRPKTSFVLKLFRIINNDFYKFINLFR